MSRRTCGEAAGVSRVDEAADRRKEAFLRLFGVDADFDGMSVERHLLLGRRQVFAGSDAQLPLDRPRPCDHFRDRMLHLQARVSFP